MTKSQRSTALTAGAGLLLLMLVSACASSKPTEHSALDPSTGELALCPSSPNCVSTRDTDEQHGIAPMTFSGSADDAMQRLLGIVNDMPRTTIVTGDERYLHAEFRSRVFRFVDDVEFVIDEEAGQIHFRSASRVGHSDLGVNRKRMEEIRDRVEGP